MNKKQPEALRLAEMLTADEWPGSVTLVSYARECVAELRRLHAENETLRAGYAAARLEIESLNAQLHAAKQINAAQFGLLAASIPGSALRASHGQAPAQAAPAAVAGPSEFLEKINTLIASINEAHHSKDPVWKQGCFDAADSVYEQIKDMLVAAPTTQPAPQQGAQEPVAWQSRTRPTWEGNTSPWSPWKPCTKEQAEDCWKTRLLNGWAYQARALYTAPQPTPAPLSDDLRDRLVAISEAIADQDDRAAQAMLREILEAPQPSTAAQGDPLVTAAPQPAPVQDYPPLPDFDTVEQHIYGACRQYITQDMLEPIHNLIRETVDADRAARAPADSVLEDADPLQGAANWLAEAHDQFGVAVLQGCLMIGYNRAKRLHDAAIAARKQGGA